MEKGYWSRMTSMAISRLNKSVFEWAYTISSTSCKNWHQRVKSHIGRLDIQVGIEDIRVPFNKKAAQLDIENAMFESHCTDWKRLIEHERSMHGNGNTLRTYKLFKHEYGVEQYVQILMSKGSRSALAKFRYGVAPLRIQTGRYERLPCACTNVLLL
jgi:hypothetical protein